MNITDSSICISVSPEILEKLQNGAGGRDIDPKKVWEEWCEYSRLHLAKKTSFEY